MSWPVTLSCGPRSSLSFMFNLTCGRDGWPHDLGPSAQARRPSSPSANPNPKSESRMTNDEISRKPENRKSMSAPSTHVIGSCWSLLWIAAWVVRASDFGFPSGFVPALRDHSDFTLPLGFPQLSPRLWVILKGQLIYASIFLQGP